MSATKPEPNVRALENGVHTIGAQQTIAELEHDDVWLLLRELREHDARNGRPHLAGGGYDAEVREDERVARAGILECHDVAAQGNTRGLEGIDDEAAMAHARDDGGGRGGLAGLHAGAGQGHHGHALRIEYGVRIKLAITHARRNADAFTQIGKIEHAADDAAVERFALVGVH
jgi:hypothetical protein